VLHTKHHNLDIINNYPTYKKFLLLSKAILAHLLHKQTACTLKFKHAAWKYLCHDLSEVLCVGTYNGTVTLKGLNKASCHGKKHLTLALHGVEWSTFYV
jgi:hypothetical protein